VDHRSISASDPSSLSIYKPNARQIDGDAAILCHPCFPAIGGMNNCPSLPGYPPGLWINKGNINEVRLPRRVPNNHPWAAEGSATDEPQKSSEKNEKRHQTPTIHDNPSSDFGFEKQTADRR
jgi:hypothetical protein